MWVYVPSDRSTQSASQADTEVSSWGVEHFSILAQSCTWKSNLRSAQSWSILWNKDSLIRLQFGQIFDQSHMNSLATVWFKSTSSQPDSHANLFPWRETEGEPMTSVTSGPKSPDLLNGLGRQSSFWKTSPESSPITSTQSDPDYLRWLTRLRKDSSVRKRSVHPTAENDYLSWPTPNTMDELPPRSRDGTEKIFGGHRKGRTAPSNLREYISPQNWPETSPQFFPTPSTQEYVHEDMVLNEKNRREPKKGLTDHSLNLQDTVSLSWPTPTVAEAGKITNRPNFGNVGLSNHPALVGYPERLKMKKSRKGDGQRTNRWRTPSAQETEGGIKDFSKKKGKGGLVAQHKLRDQVSQWPTVTATERSGTNPNTGRGEGLSKVVKHWGTPRHQDGRHSRVTDWEMGADHDGTKYSLRVQSMRNWPTPTPSDLFIGNLNSNQTKEGSMHSVNLSKMVDRWPTPNVSDWKGANHRNDHDLKRNYLRGVSTLWNKNPPDPDTRSSRPLRMIPWVGSDTSNSTPDSSLRTARNSTHKCEQSHRRLSPLFVEALLGLLPGWSDPTYVYEPWEMELSQLLVRERYESSQLN